MKIGDYFLSIPQGKESLEGYVELSHNTQYTVQLVNAGSLRCDVELSIDGRRLGTWRVDSYSHVTIERPPHDDGRFTFLAAGTPEAFHAGITVNSNTGLISAIFNPEVPSAPATELRASKQQRPGGTGLSGKSHQRFVDVEPLQTDLTKAVTINLRLCSTPIAVRPLFPNSNPIPPPLEL